MKLHRDAPGSLRRPSTDENPADRPIYDNPSTADTEAMTNRRASESDVQVLLVCGEPVIARGMELLLTAHHLRVVAVAAGALEAARALGASRPGVAILDLNLKSEAMHCVQVLGEAAPDLPVLAFGGRQPWPLQELLDAGLRGFVLTSAEPEDLVAAIRSVAVGETHLDPGFTIAPLGDPSRRGRPVLSPREREVMGLLAIGLSGQEVADRLVLSHATVRTHVQNAMRKLGAHTRAHAIAILSQDAGTTPPDLQPAN